MRSRLLAALASAALLTFTYILRRLQRAQPLTDSSAKQQPASSTEQPAASASANGSAAPDAPKAEKPSKTPKAPASSSAPADGFDLEVLSSFTAGAKIVVKGLVSKPELNGQRGKVTGHDGAKGRVNVTLKGGRQLQVKATNLEFAVIPAAECTPRELCALTASSHDALTTAHAARLIELLGTATTPIDAGLLLRCCCCVEWLLFATKELKTGKVTPFAFPTPEAEPGSAAAKANANGPQGTTIVLASSTERLEQIQKLNPAPDGHEQAVQRARGRAAFSASKLEGVGVVSLDPFMGDTAETSRFVALPAAYFPPLAHMSDALLVEASLASIVAAWGAPEGGAPAKQKKARGAACAFASHTFFCFNAAPDPTQAIIPITSTNPTGAYLLLYTCEMLVELARPSLIALGALGGKNLPATAVPADAVLQCLHQTKGTNAGVHINAFVPGIASDYKASGLSTAALDALFAVVAKEGKAGAGGGGPSSGGQLV